MQGALLIHSGSFGSNDVPDLPLPAWQRSELSEPGHEMPKVKAGETFMSQMPLPFPGGYRGRPCGAWSVSTDLATATPL